MNKLKNQIMKKIENGFKPKKLPLKTGILFKRKKNNFKSYSYNVKLNVNWYVNFTMLTAKQSS